MKNRSVLVGVLGVALICLGCSNERREAKPESIKTSAKEGSKTQDPLVLDSATLARCKAATVLVGNFEGGRLHSTGSGFISDDGAAVITNKHVVTGSDNEVDVCKLAINTGTSRGRLQRVEPDDISVFGLKLNSPKYDELDVAVIRTKDKLGEPLPLGNTENLSETEAVWAFGFPRGTNIRTIDENLPSVTVHVMSCERIERKGEKVKVAQLAGSPTHGDSGGPVITRDGNVVGVLQARAEHGSSIIYAVPTQAVRDLIKRGTDPGTLAKQWKRPLGEAVVVAKASDAEAEKPRHPNPKPVLVGKSALSYYILGESDLEGLSARELTILRNEPFARRGYMFHRRELRAIFAGSNWYVPRTSNLAAVQRALSRIEASNVIFIKRFQRERGLDW